MIQDNTTLLTANDFLPQDALESVNRSEIDEMLQSVSEDVLRAFTILHRCALSLHTKVTARVDAPCAFVYGIQKKVRLRPRFLRLALPRRSSREIHIRIDGSASDRSGWFRTIGNKHESKVIYYRVPNEGMPISECKYLVSQFIESFENTTEKHSQLHPDDPLIHSLIGLSDPPVADSAAVSNSDQQPIISATNDNEHANEADSVNESTNGDEPIKEDRNTIRWQQADFDL